MQILPLLSLRYNTVNPYTAERPRTTGNTMPRLNVLNADTVSFSGRQSMTDCLELAYWKVEPKLSILANNYLDAIQAIATKYESKGIHFARELFEDSAVKKASTKVSKVMRSKSFEIRDSIRTTLFVKNPYDLSTLFNIIIPEMKKRGYSVAKIPVPLKELVERGYIPMKEDLLLSNFFTIPHTQSSHAKYYKELKRQGYNYDKTTNILNGYLKSGTRPNKEDEFYNLVYSLEKQIDDIDIRLANDNNEIVLSSIPDGKKYLIGKPHNKYEDIQLRFVRDTDEGSKHPIYHELLIQFGPNYNRNAKLEHELVYEPLRLFKELRVPQDDFQGAANINMRVQPEIAINKYISEIKNALRTTISEKLLENGKNIDFYGDKYTHPIALSDEDIARYKKLITLIRRNINDYYNKLLGSKAGNTAETNQFKQDKLHDLQILKQIEAKINRTVHNIKQYNQQEIIKEV